MGELFRDLTTGTQTLIGQEIRLAKLEITQGLKNGAQGMAFLAVAGVFGLVGLIALAFTMVAVLSLFLPAWLSALIVTVLFFGIAGIMALLGKKKLNKASPAPQETIETLKEDQEWLKQQIR
jgi:uncharacterized membrane protein YqjE